MRRLVVAGVTSGVGKTTVACGLMAAFRARGARVAPFKCGPDYIDPSHHALAAGTTSRNLDTFMLAPTAVRELFARAAARADLAVVEGVMGLFDGRDGRDEEGSTAQVAKLLEAPVLVVIDASGTSRSAGAIALGCREFDRRVRVAGFVVNGLGSETHARWVREAVEEATGLPVVGTLRRRDDLALPERHLGLVPAAERDPGAGFFARLAALVEERFDLDLLWRVAGEAGDLPSGEAGLFPARPRSPVARIAVARDEAFSFYYEDSLDLLRAWGAELVPFSPLRDERLPEGAQGVYLGGGFPELYAEGLAANQPLREALRSAAARGLPVYGECGGLMYLGRGLTDFAGRRHAMVGLVPAESAMTRDRLTLGYRTATALEASPLLERGATARGHEFHWSRLAAPLPAERAAYALAEGEGGPEGYLAGNLLASYVHLHFGADAGMARRLIERCAAVPPWKAVG